MNQNDGVRKVAFSAESNHKCPYCQKDVESGAVVCPYCKHTFISTNPGRNAILMIIGGIVLFLILYFIISAFVNHEADREMERIEKQVREYKFYP